MASMLAIVWLAGLSLLQKDLGKASAKPKFKDIFSKSPAINYLSAARIFLFGARDVWFVIALPVYLSSVFGWEFWMVGGFLALWVSALFITITALISFGLSRSSPANIHQT